VLDKLVNHPLTESGREVPRRSAKVPDTDIVRQVEAWLAKQQR
jgi:hypothetical protein